ncbi:MAG: hypothetical protein ACQEQU_03470 [Spirochaetota bacterium]
MRADLIAYPPAQAALANSLLVEQQYQDEESTASVSFPFCCLIHLVSTLNESPLSGKHHTLYCTFRDLTAAIAFPNHFYSIDNTQTTALFKFPYLIISASRIRALLLSMKTYAPLSGFLFVV